MIDYCDVPQLFTARDTFDTLYLCLLYNDSPECLYTGIRLSSKRLSEFMNGKLDLRYLFLYPEQSEYHMKKLSECILSEDKLPTEGHYIKANSRENVIVNIPTNDRSLLKELVRKFGWACM